MIQPEILDLRGLKCPLPVLKTRAALKKLGPGGVLEVWTSDPMAAIDVPHLVREMGHAVRVQSAESFGSRFVIEKCA